MGTKLPLAIVVPAAITSIDIGGQVAAGKYEDAKFMVTGINANGRFEWRQVVKTYGPTGVGVLIHKYLGKYVNRYLPKWLPFNL